MWRKPKIFHLALLVMLFLTILWISCKSSNPTEPEIFPNTLKYMLNIDVDYDQEKIFGECELTVQNPEEESMHTLPLILYRLLDVTSITDTNGKNLTFTQDIVKFSDWKEFQVNHIQVELSPPLDSGKEQTFIIRYEGHLLGYSEVMGYVKDHINKDYTILREDCRTFPEVSYPSQVSNRRKILQSFDYTASITVPDPLVVANGGILIAKTESDGKITYTFQSLVPSWRMDFAIADYRILEDKNNKFRIFYFPEDKEGAQHLLASLVKAMELYTDWFGPLKVFRGLTAIEIPEGYGSQTDVTTILQEESSFKNQDSHYGFYHELSHLWNVKSRDKFPPRFESEGLAMFLQHLVQEKLEDKQSATETAMNKMRERLQNNFTQHPDWKDVPMIDFGKADISDLSYRKGQIFFNILYELMGEDLFLEAMGSFYQKFHDTGATAQEFVDHVKDLAPMNLDLLFEEWIYGAKSSELIMSEMSIVNIVDRYKHN
ncbi:MAG: M1 family aminopeptidase [Candidatus Aminicenantaceae bacterium]